MITRGPGRVLAPVLVLGAIALWVFGAVAAVEDVSGLRWVYSLTWLTLGFAVLAGCRPGARLAPWMHLSRTAMAWARRVVAPALLIGAGLVAVLPVWRA